MLFRRKRIIPLGAKMVVLDIGGLVGALGYLVKRQIGNPRERPVQLGGRLLFLGLERRDALFQVGDLGHQFLRDVFLVALLRRADFFRGRVPSRLRLLGLLDRRAPALVDRDQLLRLARQAAAR